MNWFVRKKEEKKNKQRGKKRPHHLCKHRHKNRPERVKQIDGQSDKSLTDQWQTKELTKKSRIE